MTDQAFTPPSLGRVARAVGVVTFLEVIRDKVLYNIVLCAFLIFGLSFLASRLTFIRPERVVLDFGLAAVNLSCAMIAIFSGAGLLNREFERRTIYVALAHPVTRAQFVLGKFMGLAMVLALNWALLSAVYLVMLGFLGERFGENYSGILFLGLLFCLVQSLVIASFSILFSTISTTSLSAVMGIGVYLIGNNVSQIRVVAAKIKAPFLSKGLLGLSSFLPNLEHFNFGTKVTYGLPVQWRFIVLGLLYGLVVVTVVLLVAGRLIRAKEV